MILYLTMSIIQGLVQKENVGALQDTRNCFVYIAWFPMLMIICIFAKAGTIIVWGLLKIMRLKNFKELFCEDCGRCFFQESCFESHKTKKLNGGYETYCSFLRTLRTCNKCRHEFSLSIKCHHFGKTNNKRQHRNIYFSNYSSKEYCGPSKYVKCGYCSDFYVKGFSGNHACFLRNSDSIFGDVKKRSKTIHSHNVFLL